MLLSSLGNESGGVVSVVVSWVSSVLEHFCNVIVVEKFADWSFTLTNKCFECCLQIWFLTILLLIDGSQSGLRLHLAAVGEHLVVCRFVGHVFHFIHVGEMTELTAM